MHDCVRSRMQPRKRPADNACLHALHACTRTRLLLPWQFACTLTQLLPTDVLPVPVPAAAVCLLLRLLQVKKLKKEEEEEEEEEDSESAGGNAAVLTGRWALYTAATAHARAASLPAVLPTAHNLSLGLPACCVLLLHAVLPYHAAEEEEEEEECDCKEECECDCKKEDCKCDCCDKKEKCEHVGAPVLHAW